VFVIAKEADICTGMDRFIEGGEFEKIS